MKNINLVLLCSILSGCGQPGPLYLPTDKPPVYVQPTEDQGASKENKEPQAEQSPTQPTIDQPTKQ